MMILLALVHQCVAAALVSLRRPSPTTWGRTLCGTPSSVQPPIAEGTLEIGRDYPGNDIPPCGVSGCVMAAHATIADCKRKCSTTGLCVGYIFAPLNCSARSGPMCYTKSALTPPGIARACRNSQTIGYPGSNGTEIATKWASEVSADKLPLPEYPRPQMVRVSQNRTVAYETLRDTGDPSNWQSLNGLWEWERAADYSDAPMLSPPFGRTLNRSILVPFPFESCLSGVAPRNMAGMAQSMWYRLTFVIDHHHHRRHGRGAANANATSAPPGQRTLLHFGAIDWLSSIFVDRQHVANHTGGYDAIDVDITDALARNSSSSEHELLVYVFDPSNLGDQPNGKQNSMSPFYPGGGQYTPSSGIWQSVWLEAVPPVHIGNISLRQNSEDTLTVSAAVVGGAGPARGGGDGTTVSFTAYESGSTSVVAAGTAAPDAAFSLRIPSPRLWGPQDPHLYDIKVTLVSAARPSSTPAASVAIDEVVGYFGLRSFHLGKQAPGSSSSNATRPLLNGKFIFLAGWLDQSWWPDGQYTAPTDAALASDLRAVKRFGLNMVRLHMKVNPSRWYWHADRLGIVVFQDMVQKICTTKCTDAMRAHYLSDLRAMIHGRRNHPCVVQFTLLNEQDMWQLFAGATPPRLDLPALLALARALAPDHLIDMESGANGQYGKSAARARLGDVVDFHTYPAPAVKPSSTGSQYAMLGEFGGVGAFVAGKEWRPPTPKQKSCFAYNLPLHPLATPADEARAYIEMAGTLLAWSDQVSASVYTQITDVELECDGFLNYDRTDKFDAASIAAVKAANLRLTAPEFGMEHN